MNNNINHEEIQLNRNFSKLLTILYSPVMDSNACRKAILKEASETMNINECSMEEFLDFLELQIDEIGSDPRNYHKKYYENHKAHINHLLLQKVQCSCGRIVAKMNLTRHMNSRNHKQPDHKTTNLLNLDN